MSEPTPPIVQETAECVLSYGGSPPSSPGKRGWAISEIVAWAVIVLAVAGVLGANAQEKAAARSKSSDERLEVLLLSRYAMGTHELMRAARSAAATTLPEAASGPARVDSKLEPMLEELDKAAKGPTDRFRAAIFRGSFESPEAAQERLDELGGIFPGLQNDADTVREMRAGAIATTDGRWKEFEKKYGWFAEVAASGDTPKGSPERAAVANAGFRTMGAMALGVLLGLGGGAAGLVLLVIAIFLLSQKRVKKAFDRSPALPTDRRAYVQAFAVYLAGTMGLAYGFSIFVPEAPRLLKLAVLPLSFGAALFWPVIAGQQGWMEWRAAMGLHAGRGILREIGAGFVGYTTGFPIFILGTLVTIALAKISGASTSHPITEALTEGPAVLALVFVAASIWAPITEELMFRGALFGHLRERFGWWISAPVVAGIFAIIHPQGWAGVPALAALAFVFAGIREWRGSIIGCMTAHALHNTATLVVMTLMLS